MTPVTISTKASRENRMRTLCALISLMLLASCQTRPTSATSADRTLFTGATVYATAGGPPMKDGAILVEKG
ncbi:MAG TPA: hypothetical protein VIL97_01545, partial [Thermoanaerobaculia bacterium]